MRHTVAILVGFQLSGLITSIPAAQADPPNPLYALMDTVAARLQTADPVAAFKWVNGGPITDTPRAQQVLAAATADAAKYGIDPQPVRMVFENQIHAAEGIEYTRFGQWTLDPAAAPTTAPDLSASRTAIDGYNHTIVNEIALHQNSLHGPQCAPTLDEARTSVADDRQLDPLYQQALAFATHSYCG